MSTVNPKIYYQKFSTDAQINNYTKVYNSLTKNRPGTKKKADLPSVILIDNYGLSFYTSYLACGLSKYNHVNLLGISEEDYRVTGASKVERISFSNIGKKLPKKNSILSIIFARQFVWFYVLSTAFFRRSKYDIVHVQGHLPTFFVFVPFLKLMHKRIVWTLHDVNLRPSSKGLRGRLELLYVNSVTLPSFIRRYADKIIVHGEFLKRQLVTLGVKEDKIVTVPIFDYGYLLKFDDNTGERKLEKHHRDDIPAHTGYILIFGRIKPYKGIDVFIDALRIVREKLGDSNALRVLIAGRGDASYFKHLLTEQDLKYIQIRNEFIPNQKIPQIFNRSLFVVLPYTDASQSAVTSLAYTFSKPVVASNAGSISEYVEHDRTGLIFEPGNTEQLANHIIELIQNPRKCLEMGKNANQKVRQEMSLEKCSQIINETYHTH